VVLGIFVEQVSRNHSLNHVLQDIRTQIVVSDRFRVLRRDDDGIHALHFAVRRIFHCNLRFSIRTEVRAGSILADFRKFLAKLLRQRNWQRHQLRRLIASKSKHHSLVAGASGVYAHGDVAGLFVNAGDHGAGVGVKAVNGIVIADGLNYSADDGLEIDVSFGGNFSGDDDQTGAGQGFAGDAAGGIFTQAGVEDSVGNLVGNLVGMPLGD